MPCQSGNVPRLLIVHHTPSPALVRLHRAVVAGASADGIEGVEIVERAALEAGSADVLAADGYVLGTPANLGYMSGALKHFFDLVYNDARGPTARRPFGFWVHGESDTTGAVLAIERITTGLEWRAVQAPLGLLGAVDEAEVDAGWELGAAVAAVVMTNG